MHNLKKQKGRTSNMQRTSDDFLTPEEEEAIRKYESGEDTTEQFDSPEGLIKSLQKD